MSLTCMHPSRVAFLSLVAICCAALAPCPAAAAEPQAIDLFNGRDFTGWTFVLEDSAVDPADVWSVEDGVIVCKGKPKGYMRTVEDYENYRLTLQWRWAPGSYGGNSGVLVHTTDPGAIGVWPRSLEAQLAKDNAGDFWVIGVTIEIDNPEGRIQGRRHLNLVDNAERPLGEWNDYEVVCDGDDVTVSVNGQVVNVAHKVSQTRGAICLQSEGAPVHFRNVRLTPIED